jgi:ferritin-like metal-binding protein YciE
MSELSAGNTKLVQYLNEAYGSEMRLETTLQAHISMTASSKYRRRLKDHLAETRRHGREVKQRIKRLGGTAQVVAAPGPDIVSDAAGALIGGAEKAVALAQGPLHAVRGTGEAEKQLKNARTEYASEAEEIATYATIETLADVLGDTETKQLARSIRREEERMLSFLEREINTQTEAVARAEIPSAERRLPARRKRPSSGKARTASSRKASTGSRARPALSTGGAGAAKSTKRRSTKPRTQSRSAAGTKHASGRHATGRTPARSTAATKRAAARRTTRGAQPRLTAGTKRALTPRATAKS